MLCVLNPIPVFIWPLLLSLIIVITCLLFLPINGVIIELLKILCFYQFTSIPLTLLGGEEHCFFSLTKVEMFFKLRMWRLFEM